MWNSVRLCVCIHIYIYTFVIIIIKIKHHSIVRRVKNCIYPLSSLFVNLDAKFKTKPLVFLQFHNNYLLSLNDHSIKLIFRQKRTCNYIIRVIIDIVIYYNIIILLLLLIIIISILWNPWYHLTICNTTHAWC